MAAGSFHSQHLVMYAKAGGQPYNGRFSVRLQVSASEWHHHYHSPHDQTQHHFQLHQTWGNVINIEVSLYKAGTAVGTPVDPIETKLVPIIKNGQDGLPGAPGGGGGGLVTLTTESNLSFINIPGAGTYPMNTVVNLQATPWIMEGGTMRSFQGWQCYAGGASNWLSSPYNFMTSVTLHGSCTVRANYSYQ